MDQIVQQRQSVRDFWAAKGRDMVSISSIDTIYTHYVNFIKDYMETRRTKDPVTKRLRDDVTVTVGPLPPINRYIFRTMIRKMGYKNGHVTSSSASSSLPLTST